MTVGFLAGECFSCYLVRAVDFDVSRSADLVSGAADEQVLVSAVAQDRILLTKDSDFGDSVFSAPPAHTRCREGRDQIPR
jgi:predicted nuclease of predicted toxin-antitoxin system